MGTLYPFKMYQLTCNRGQREPCSVALSSHSGVKPVGELRTTQKYGLHTLLQLRQDSWHLPSRKVTVVSCGLGG